MTFLRIAGIALMLACAAGGLVWFGWGLVANLAARRPAAASEEPAGTGKEPAPKRA